MLSKLLIYGQPGTGKSVFAFQFPNPFFICTDGNYEYLKLFGAKEENHISLTNWNDLRKVIQEMYSTDKYDKYQTIVLDLLEDSWKWCEYEWLEKNKIEHPSDMGFGKAYDITRNKFFTEISKLLTLPKNILLLSHEQVISKKTKKGLEYMVYAPSNRIPDKLLDMIEGRLTGCLRCHIDITADENGKQIKKRYLNLIPQDDEYGVIRGIDENKVPHMIPLLYKEYNKVMEEQQLESAKEFLKMMENDEDVKQVKKQIKETPIEIKEQPNVVETIETKEETNIEETPKRRRRRKDVTEISETETIEIPKQDETTQEVIEEKSQEIIEEKTNEQKKLDILSKIRKQKEMNENEENVSSKQDLLNKLRRQRNSTQESVQETVTDNEIKQETKTETREEKLARLRAMRG